MGYGRLLGAACLCVALAGCRSSTHASDASFRPDGGNDAGGTTGSTSGQGGGNGGAGATGGAAGGATGGTPATGGTAGVAMGGASAAGGTRATGGAAGGATGGARATGGGGGTTPDATDVCRTVVRVLAERMAPCLGYQTVESYMRYANACPEYEFNPDSNRTVAEVVACLPALAKRSCTDVVMNVMPDCFPTGKRDAGAACAFSSQCKSGFCNGDGVSCGACGDGARPAGSACTRWWECAAGLHCSRGGTCVENGTPVYAAEGEPCDLDATPMRGCAGDLYCELDGNGRPGACFAPPPAGYVCASNDVGNGMGSSMICAAGTTCVQGLCQPPGGCGLGMQCDSTSYCGWTANGAACMASPSLGGACSSTIPCLAPAVCGGDGFTCVLRGKAGEPCSNDNPCDKFLTCTGGTCQPMTAALCPP